MSRDSGILLNQLTVHIRITPPYKILVEFLPQLKSRLVELQQALAVPKAVSEPETETAVSGNPDTSQPEHDETRQYPNSDSARAAQLELLISFVETQLADWVQLRADISNGSLELISFDELWHLFKPGDLVISRNDDDDDSGRERLFKVYFVTGGQIRRKESTTQALLGGRSLTEQGQWSSLDVFAYTMEFDGTQIGPKDHELSIEHYTGKKSITDLPVYPLRYHPKKDLALYFEDRGRRVLSSVGHRFYEGLGTPFVGRDKKRMLLGRPEDISGEVYIDFHEFSQATYRTYEFSEISQPSLDANADIESIQGANGTDIKFRHIGHEVDVKLAQMFYSHNRKGLEPFVPSEEPESMTPEIYQLFGHSVPAYVFRHRRWCK